MTIKGASFAATRKGPFQTQEQAKADTGMNKTTARSSKAAIMLVLALFRQSDKDMRDFLKMIFRTRNEHGFALHSIVCKSGTFFHFPERTRFWLAPETRINLKRAFATGTN